MIDVAKFLPDLGEDVQRLSGLIQTACETETDPGVRAQLLGLKAMMEHYFGQVQETLPAAEAALNQRIQGLSEAATRLEKEVQETEQHLSEAEAAAAQVPVPPAAPPFDPTIGTQLRDDLLTRFGPDRPAAPESAGAVAEMPSAVFQPPAVPEQTPAPVAGPYAEPNVEETPPRVVAALLQLAAVEARDVLYNLGCGDGRLLISAASKHSARGVGIEGRPAAAEAARANVRKAYSQRLVTIHAGDPLAADVSPATVVFLTLGAADNDAMRVALLHQLRAGARVATHQGGLADWPPDEEQVLRDPEGRTYRLRLWRIQDRPGGAASSMTNLSEIDWES